MGQDKSTPPNHGVLVELLQESQESQDLVLTDQDRLLLVTCAEVLECSLHSKSGENGTQKPMSLKEDTLLPQHSLPQPALHLLWPEVTELTVFQSSHSLLTP